MPSSRPTFAAFWLLLAAAGLTVLPATTQATIRLAVGDALRPGCIAWKFTQENLTALATRWPVSQPSTLDDTESVQTELATAQRRNRELELQLAALHDTLAAHQPPLFGSSEPSTTERLAKSALIPAAVIGPSSAADFRQTRWLDQGAADGLVEEAPILKSERPLIDLGRDADVAPEDKLILGRSVIGKVQHAGRWTSTFLLITDAEFRGRAQLVRPASDGYLFGAKGVLKGDGKNACRLEGIPAAESVEVGDSVYTADRDGVSPGPLYYGTVTEAELEDRAKTWRIVVRPVEWPEDLTTVEVLRTAINRNRVLAN